MAGAMVVYHTAADAGEVVTIFRDDTINHNFRAGGFAIVDSLVKKLRVQAVSSTVQSNRRHGQAVSLGNIPIELGYLRRGDA